MEVELSNMFYIILRKITLIACQNHVEDDYKQLLKVSHQAPWMSGTRPMSSTGLWRTI